MRTVDGDAKDGEDYEGIDEEVKFNAKDAEAEVAVKIIDDDGWEPDEDFYVELYDKETGNRLIGEDTRTRVTILDDDKPGMLVFDEKQQIRHPANEEECRIVVNRIQGTDGKISVKYETIQLGLGEQSAVPNQHYIPVKGELVFKHQESQDVIKVKILPSESPDQERNEIFGVKLYGAEPAAVKISKKDTAVIEIVTDSEKKKQAEALQ